jgi:Flp pilus assembly protein TadG
MSALVRQLSCLSRHVRVQAARLVHDQRGVTAIEFGLIALPFFTLLCGILEVCCIFLVTTTLEHGAMEASRRIRTGELQSSGGNADSFKTLVCQGTFNILNCSGSMYVDVRTYQDFDSVDNPNPIVSGQVSQGNLQFQPGTQGSIVVARVYYQWDIITPMLGAMFSNMAGNKRLIEASVAFRNEP